MRSADVLARFGGEEFSALLAHTPESGAVDVAERIRASIERHAFQDTDGQPFSITISIGVATLDGGSEQAVQLSTQGLVGQADRALYKAKAAGRNRVVSLGELAASTASQG